jgi:hypothetical protein
MRFSDVFAADAAVLVDQFGEAVELRPPGESPRTVYAVIKRPPPETSLIGSKNGRPAIDVTLSTDPAAGQNPIDIDWDNYRIGVSYLRGGELQDFGFVKSSLQQSPGRWTIRLK